MYEAKKQMHGDNALRGKDGRYLMDHCGPSGNDGGTAEKVAKEFGVGRTTVKRAKHFLDGVNAAEEVSPGFRQDIISGAVKAPKSVISEIRNIPDDKKGEVVEAIQSGTGEGLEKAKEIIANVGLIWMASKKEPSNRCLNVSFKM